MKRSFDRDSRLTFLMKQFAKFRGRHHPRARIPAHLRRGVLAAIDSGVLLPVLMKTLRLNEPQIAAWRGRSNPKLATMPTPPQPRILDVVGSSPPVGAMPSGLRVSYEAGRLLLEVSFG